MKDGLTHQGQSFPEMAAAHIDLANTQGRDTDHGLVNIAFLHSAARYAAFVTAVASSDKAALQSARNENLDRITAEFREYLELHYTEYSENFDTYVVKSNNSPASA